jgi:hypothetical protein
MFNAHNSAGNLIENRIDITIQNPMFKLKSYEIFIISDFYLLASVAIIFKEGKYNGINKKSTISEWGKH